MLDAATPTADRALPFPPRPARDRSALEAFLVLRRNPLELWGARAYREDVLPGRFLGRPQLLLNAPDGIRHVLVANSDNYKRNVGTHRVLRPVLGAGLFLADGEAWRHQRRTMAPAFAPRTMPILAGHVARATDEHTTRLAAAAARPVELLPRLQALALDIAGRSMFSLEVGTFGPALRTLLLEYAARYAQPGFLDLLLPASMDSPLDRARKMFRARWLALMDQVIAARRAQPGDPDRPRDLLDLLDAARDPQTGAGFSHAQLRDEVSTLILAGHETTAVTLFWACYAAAMLPEQQDAPRRRGRHAADLDDPAALPLIRAHVDETLRLYPAAFLIVREARAADEVAGHRIAAGTVVSISPWVVHRHHARWTEPDVFDAARFAPGAPPPERFTYLPFGAGPRICIGAQFALTEAVLVLARLLRAFRLEVIGGGGVRPRGFVTTQPDRPVYFALTPRRPAMSTFSGKVAFVTGGASGIGAALVRLLREAGAAVDVGDLRGDPPVDVTDPASIEAALARTMATHGKLDAVFSNAGVLMAGAVETMPIADWDRTIAVNLRGAFLTARFAIPHLRASGGGSIVFTASTAALVGARHEAAYDASKHAILGLTKALAAEVAPDGIRVNAVAPGWIDTPFNDPMWQATAEQRDAAERQVLATIPLARQGRPEEAAQAMLYLASPAASYVTGQVLVVDGGLLAIR